MQLPVGSSPLYMLVCMNPPSNWIIFRFFNPERSIGLGDTVLTVIPLGPSSSNTLNVMEFMMMMMIVEMYRLFRSSQPSSQPHDQPASQPLSGRSSITENTRNWGLDYVYRVDGHVT